MLDQHKHMHYSVLQTTCRQEQSVNVRFERGLSATDSARSPLCYRSAPASAHPIFRPAPRHFPFSLRSHALHPINFASLYLIINIFSVTHQKLQAYVAYWSNDIGLRFNMKICLQQISITTASNSSAKQKIARVCYFHSSFKRRRSLVRTRTRKAVQASR